MNAGESFNQPLLGASVERVEDERLLTGRGQFVDDHHPPGLLHAVILRSSVAHGVIRCLDVEAARTMSGVHAIFTADDVEAATGSVPTIALYLAPRPELERFAQPVIAKGKVRYVGEPLAIVVADSPALAEDAVDAIYAEIEPLPVVADTDQGRSAEAILFEEFGSNVAITYTASKGDVLNVTAPYRRRERFRVQRHTAVCMETRGVVALWNDTRSKLTVLGAAKMPFQNRKRLAQQMHLPEDCIEMIEGDVGGGFGVRGNFHPEDYLIPFVARQLGRPVKWVEDRRENLLHSNHAREVDIEIEIACEMDGTIVALSGEAWMDAGGYFRSTIVPGRNVAQFLSGPYRIPNVHVQCSLVLTNKCPIGTYRGPGRFEADFFRERIFDIAAGDLGLDRVEFRRRNLPTPAEMPYAIATVNNPPKAEALDSGDYAAALDRCLEEFGWSEKSRLQGKLLNGRYQGIAVGCYIEGGAAGPRENARIVIQSDGTVHVYVGSANVGQGIQTALAQIAADALHVPMSRVRVYTGSTTYLKEGFGAFHSRSVVMGGSAVLNAATNLKARIVQAAADHFGCSGNEVALGENLSCTALGRSIAIDKLVGAGLQADGTFENVGNKHTYSYGTAAAHVSVDPQTGHVQVEDYVTVEDVGRVINPLTARGQIVGAVVQGLGGALLEHLQYDEQCQFLTASLADYLMPTATDFPNVRAIVLGDYPSPLNPLGAKGGGEGGIVPVGGVIANAVANALSTLVVQPDRLPLTPPYVWKLIERRAGK
ncbi:MAG TPA: xanthine dehydrogenase family protein molybdopterin-binding subunit [Burkholderiales bacterium]|nr:xanthine dehydrogenase family protein molybdopterin-binding subunit [Burkholderiales bacterium]